MKGYILVYADNLQEMAHSVVYLDLAVAKSILPNVQALHRAENIDREIWIQPIDIDGRTVDQLAR
ncbi:MAG: hypothetical protein KW802_01425 [Candidatus Doudnabacteria bacterium]|nr:hypothetical protein [Candidatus Doudnabacteria bacterium]